MFLMISKCIKNQPRKRCAKQFVHARKMRRKEKDFTNYFPVHSGSTILILREKCVNTKNMVKQMLIIKLFWNTECMGNLKVKMEIPGLKFQPLCVVNKFVCL